MHLRPLLALLLISAVFGAEPAEARWNALPATARDLVERILACNRVLEPELDALAARAAFVALVDQARPAASADGAMAAIAALNQAVLTDRQVSYLSRQYWRDSSFVAALLRGQGNCLATTTLYVAVGRALGLPVQAMFIPEHAFACWSTDQERLNIETTAGGSVCGDYGYLAGFAIDAEAWAYHGWMTPLDDATLIAQLQLVTAQHLAGQQRYADALLVLADVRTALPGRGDLELLALAWQANVSRDRSGLIAAARGLTTDAATPRPARLCAWQTLAEEHGALLERREQRAALTNAYALAGWHEQDEILEQLSTCLRGLRDHAGAALCMELAVARDPDDIWKQAWYAGMLSEVGRIEESLAIIAKVRDENPEESYFATMQAGLLVLAGQRAEGRKVFDALIAPRSGIETFETNRAWFLAVWGEREQFYPQFERALGLATEPSILSWVAEDDDLDAYRAEARFRAAVEACRERLLGPAAASPGPAAD